MEKVKYNFLAIIQARMGSTRLPKKDYVTTGWQADI